MRTEARFRSIGHTAGNFAKTLLPGAFAHRYELEGTLQLTVLLPSSEEPLVFRARAVASRFYYTAGHMAGAHQVLLRQVGSSVVESVIDQLRSDARLRVARR